MNLQVANFEDLLTTYYNRTAAHKAAKHLGALIRSGDQLALARLLRDHRMEAIRSKEEIDLRAATDRLMNCFCVMEIASLTNFVPELQKSEFGGKMLPILESNCVRQYYEEFYPEKLPQLFRCRLAGTNRVVEKLPDRTDSNVSVMAFLELDRRFMDKLDDGYLLRMLDSFIIQGYRFGDIVKLIGRPEEFIDRILLAPEERDVCSQALFEFSLFMQFCFDLHHLLSKIESQPLLQSAIWNHYRYWFDIVGDELRKRLDDALSQFLKWKPVGDNEDAAKAVQVYVHKARNVLTILTSKGFATPVDDLLKKVSG